MEGRAELTDTVMDALGRAQDEARALGHGYIGTEHLVIVLAGSNGRGSDNIRAQGVGQDALRAELRRLFDENDWNRYVPDEQLLATVGVDLAAIREKTEAEFGEGALPMRTASPGFTRRTIRILEAASARTGARRADVDDVFAALVADGDSVGVTVLRRAGVDVDVLRSALT